MTRARTVLCALSLALASAMTLGSATAVATNDPVVEEPYVLPTEWGGYTPTSSSDPLAQVSRTGLVPMNRGPAASRLKGTWGVYGGPGEEAWRPYVAATGKAKTQLGHIALNPKPRWFGSWIPDSQIADTLTNYIAESQHGDPRAWVQLTIFRMDPWYKASQTTVPSKAKIASYKRWIDASAAAIGSTPTMLFLQPDSTFLATVPKPKLSAGLIRYAARTYGALPNTRVYLETGGWDWPHPGQGGARKAAKLLTMQGMKYADGVVTNTTHYNPTSKDIERIAELAKIFAGRGQRIRGVINTSSNGKGFEFGKYRGKDPDHATVCASRARKGTCASIGIPPTTDVANPKWGLSAKHRKLAAKHVDAYLWVGRPWLHRQNYPYLKPRAKKLVVSSPFYSGPR